MASALITGLTAGGAAFHFIPYTAYGIASSIENGAWTTSEHFGATDAGLLIRAIVSRTGLFALSKEETIYYVTYQDSEGARLDGSCRYRIAGEVPEARWWSITVYGANGFLIESSENRYSIDANDVDGVIDLLIAKDAQGVFLPVENGPFSLTLRLYNPAATVYENLATTPLPTIAREEC